MSVATTRVRSFALGSIATMALLVSNGFALSPASADTVSPEMEFATRINEARITAGLSALVVQPKLADQARSWSVKMSEASGGNLGRACQLSHNPNLAREVPLVWRTLGENVGCAASNVEAVHQAFMDSPEHRRNILNPKFDSVGIAIATSDTTMFVTEVFMQRGVKPRGLKQRGVKQRGVIKSSQLKATAKTKRVARPRKAVPRTP
jgi:Cysteine-rich secretory protein family